MEPYKTTSDDLRKKGVPGTVFSVTIQRELESNPTRLMKMREEGLVWTDYDDLGNGFDCCAPENNALYIEAMKEHQLIKQRINCRACFKKWGTEAYAMCPKCFFNPLREKDVRAFKCWNCGELTKDLKYIWEPQENGSVIVLRYSCECGLDIKLTAEHSEDEILNPSNKGVEHPW